MLELSKRNSMKSNENSFFFLLFETALRRYSITNWNWWLLWLFFDKSSTNEYWWCAQIDDSMNTELTFHKYVFGMKLIQRGNLFALGFCHLYFSFGSFAKLLWYWPFIDRAQVRRVSLFFFVITDHDRWLYLCIRFWNLIYETHGKTSHANEMKLSTTIIKSIWKMESLLPEPILKHKFYQYYSFILNI